MATILIKRTEEEKTFRRRAGYFLVTQVVAVLVFLSVMSSNDFSEVEVDDDEGFSYD
jgi:metaxin